MGPCKYALHGCWRSDRSTRINKNTHPVRREPNGGLERGPSKEGGIEGCEEKGWSGISLPNPARARRPSCRRARIPFAKSAAACQHCLGPSPFPTGADKRDLHPSGFAPGLVVLAASCCRCEPSVSKAIRRWLVRRRSLVLRPLVSALSLPSSAHLLNSLSLPSFVSVQLTCPSKPPSPTPSTAAPCRVSSTCCSACALPGLA